MPERMHEILQKKWRAGHEYQQRHVRLVEPEGSPEQLDEKAERDQPDTAAQREYQPHRHFCEKQRNDRPDQRALGKAEMIIDQQVDVGNVGLARDLVEKNPDQNRDVDGQHQPPGVFPHAQNHSAPRTLAKSGADLSHGECVGRNALSAERDSLELNYSKLTTTAPGPLSNRERVGVRGYGPSSGRNPSPGATRRPLPMGEVYRVRGTSELRFASQKVERDILQDEPAQIRVLGEIADVLLHIVGIDLDGLAIAVGGGEGNLVEHALHHG